VGAGTEGLSPESSGAAAALADALPTATFEGAVFAMAESRRVELFMTMPWTCNTSTCRRSAARKIEVKEGERLTQREQRLLGTEAWCGVLVVGRRCPETNRGSAALGLAQAAQVAGASRTTQYRQCSTSG
jgi:hypothetical protein